VHKPVWADMVQTEVQGEGTGVLVILIPRILDRATDCWEL